MLKILHIIPRLSNSGPTRTLLCVVQALNQINPAVNHRLIVLDPAIHPFVVARVKKAGIAILRQPDLATITDEIANADVIHLHFWNHPSLYEFLRGEWPPMRLLIWSKIFGAFAPQVITPNLIQAADFVLTSSVGSLALSCFENLSVETKQEKTDFALSPANFERLQNIVPQSHDTFNVGYIGTANFTKIHPSYVSMSAAIDIPNIKFIVCGGNDQAIAESVKTLGISERFEFRGYVENISSVLEILDVFGYPLCPQTYATSEQALQEAMYASIPPVVFPYGGVPFLVNHEETGLIVNSESEYEEAIKYLYENPQIRKRMGEKAKEYAQEHFRPEITAQTMNRVYNYLMGRPKQPYRGLGDKAKTPSEGFAKSLGKENSAFMTSLTSSNFNEIREAHKEISQASEVLVAGEGGIFHYRNFYPSDGYLRLWSGLVLAQRGQKEKAEAEFQAAIELGCDPNNVS